MKKLTELYYQKDNEKYFIGDKVSGIFEYGELFGIVKFGEFDAYWPTGAHDFAYAYGFYVETEKHEGYSICQVSNLSKVNKS